jgi:hypothetical protein
MLIKRLLAEGAGFLRRLASSLWPRQLEHTAGPHSVVVSVTVEFMPVCCCVVRSGNALGAAGAGAVARSSITYTSNNYR